MFLVNKARKNIAIHNMMSIIFSSEEIISSTGCSLNLQALTTTRPEVVTDVSKRLALSTTYILWYTKAKI